jgi:AraC family transcriptional regulator
MIAYVGRVEKEAEARAEAIAFAEAHLAAIAFIEEHLFEPMSVKTIAASSGFSPSRFSRRFTRLQGESVMAYVRGRRLEGAMRRILAERAQTAKLRMVDLAFDCGFDSQEAFTRAFARAFGLTPGRLQSSGATGPLIRKRKILTEEPVIHERIAQQPETRLAGLPKHFSPATFVEMPGLWQRFLPLLGFEGQLGGGETYGVRRKRYPADGSFDFLLAVRIEERCVPPRPLEILSLPAGSYLVYRHMLRQGDLYPQMTAAAEIIWAERLPRSGHVLLENAPDFQLYPAGFKVKGGWIDHYLPIKN